MYEWTWMKVAESLFEVVLSNLKKEKRKRNKICDTIQFIKSFFYNLFLSYANNRYTGTYTERLISYNVTFGFKVPQNL